MAEILLTPEELRDRAQLLRDCVVTNNDVISTLDSVINGLVNDWEGEAQQAFAESYAAKRKTFEDFSMDMEVFAKFLVEYSDTMQDQEKMQAGKARELAG